MAAAAIAAREPPRARARARAGPGRAGRHHAGRAPRPRVQPGLRRARAPVRPPSRQHRPRQAEPAGRVLPCRDNSCVCVRGCEGVVRSFEEKAAS